MSSLYQSNIRLLDPPSRTSFSLIHDGQRAVLPDFADVQHLRDFTHRLIYFNFTVPTLFIQVKCVAGTLCFLVCVVGSIVLRRAYESSFWLVRIQSRPTGKVVGLNGLLVFAIIEGIFAIWLVEFLFQFCSWYESQKSSPQLFFIDFGCMWTVLIFGAIAACSGTLMATPNMSQHALGVGRPENIIKRIVSHSWFINLAGLCSPIVIVVIIAVLTFIGNRDYQHALKREEQWQIKYAGQDQFTESMVHDSQLIWFHQIRAMYWMGLVMCVWVIFAWAMCASYTYVASRLLAVIGEELRRSQSGTRAARILTTMAVASEDEENSNEIQHQHPDPERPRVSNVGSLCEMPSSEFAMRAMSVHEEDGQAQKANSSNEDGEIVPASPTFEKPSMRPVMRIMAGTAATFQRNKNGDSSIRRFNLRLPNIVMKKIRPGTAVPRFSKAKHEKELQKAYRHIWIQMLAISPACFAFGSNALLLAITLPGSAEWPRSAEEADTYTAKFLGIAMVVCIWLTAVAGTITLCAICLRTYEGMLHSMSASVLSNGGSSHADRFNTAASQEPQGQSEDVLNSNSLVNSHTSVGASAQMPGKTTFHLPDHPQREKNGFRKLLGDKLAIRRPSSGTSGTTPRRSQTDSMSFFETKTKTFFESKSQNEYAYQQHDLSPTRSMIRRDDSIEQPNRFSEDTSTQYPVHARNLSQGLPSIIATHDTPTSAGGRHAFQNMHRNPAHEDDDAHTFGQRTRDSILFPSRLADTQEESNISGLTVVTGASGIGKAI